MSASRSRLRAEILIVLTITFGMSGVRALLRLTDSLLNPAPLNEQSVTLNASQSATTLLDLAFQLCSAAVLFAWGAQHAPAAIGAITNAMTVLFTALIAFLFFGEKIGARRAVALLVGFIGVLVLATGKAGGLSVGPAALAGATASLLYGIGYNLVKRHMADLPPASSAAATLGCAALLLSPLAVTHWPTAPVPGVAWACAGALGIVCTGLAYRVYYRLIQRIGPARAATVTYLIPVFGALLAWAILGEPLTWTMLLAAVLILGSVAVSQRAAARRPR